jgi:hypothetical protein
MPQAGNEDFVGKTEDIETEEARKENGEELLVIC